MKITNKIQIKELPYQNTHIKDMDGEIWIDAFGFDGYYQVSNFGRIKTTDREVCNGAGTRMVKSRIRKQTVYKDRISLPFSKENKIFSINVSRLIYQSFNINENIDGLVISHKNRCQFDNRLKNLVAETVQKNHNDNVNKYNTGGIIEHLQKQNIIRSEKCSNMKEKTCKICSTTKNVSKFRKNYNTCMDCEKTQRHEKYIKNRVLKQYKKICIKKDGEILEKFNSRSNMIKKYNLNTGGIWRTMNGIVKHHKGYTFSYIDD